MAPHNFFFDILDDYQNGRFCDLEICGITFATTTKMNPIRCHKLIMCSVIEQWRNLITEDTDRLHLPDFDHGLLKKFIDLIYYKLTLTVHNWDDIDPVIATFLGIDWTDQMPAFPICQKEISSAHHSPYSSDKDTVKYDPVTFQVASEVDLELDIYDHAMDVFDVYNVGDCDYDVNHIEERDDEELDANHDHLIKHEYQLDAEEFSETESLQSSHAKKTLSRHRKSKQGKKRQKQSRRPTPNEKALMVNWKRMQSDNHTRFIQVEDVKKILNSGESGALKVDVTSSRVTPDNKTVLHKSLTQSEGVFFALVGIQQNEERILGKSLAWTTDLVHEVEESFYQTISAFHHVFGLSRVSLTSASCLFTYSGVKRRSFAQGLVNDLYRKFLYQSTRMDLKNELNHPEVLEAFSVSEPDRKSLNLPLKDYSITMDPNLDQFEDIVLVGVYKHGVEVRQIKLPEDNAEYAATVCSRLLTLVWVGGNKTKTFPESLNIYQAFKTHVRLNYTGKTVRKLLASDEELPRPLPFVTCHICGKQFQENIYMNNMIMHKHNHAINDFKCDCDIQIRSFAQKKRHYEERHQPSRTSKRPKIADESVSSKTESPPSVYERPQVCDICGKVFISANTLKLHVERSHADLHCPHCEQDFGSIVAFKRHWRKSHPTLEMELPSHWISCDQCDAAFPRKSDYTKHWTLNHGPTDMQPFQCGLCEKGFCDKSKLRYHMINIHIKNRPYECRSEGCTVAFNFNGNLYAHEKKVHGKSFGKTASLVSVLPDSKLLEMGCKLTQPIRTRH